MGAPNTWPSPVKSRANSSKYPKNVSLVPKLIAAFFFEVIPAPIRLFGLSPENATILVPSKKPNLCTKYGEISPIIAFGDVKGGNFTFSPGAVASKARLSHSLVVMFIKFIPAPSPWSIGAFFPINIEAKKELTKCITTVSRYFWGSFW